MWALAFGPFVNLPMLKADKALMMALAERWSPITRTFNLPMGEIGIPPIDFYMMIGLSMDNVPPPTTDDFDTE